MAGTIPQYFRREQLDTSGLPRAPAGQLADVGARLAPDAMARFGGALQDIGLDRLNRILNARTQSQYTEGKALWEEAETKFLKELERNQDYEGYDKKYKAHNKDLSKQILVKKLTSDAKEALFSFIETKKAALGKQVAAAYLRKERDYERAQTYKDVRIFEMAGNAPAAKAAIIEARDAGYFGAEESVKRIAEVDANTAIYQRQKVVATAHDAAKAMPFKEALAYLNDLEGVTSAERNDLIARRKRQNEIETATTDPQVRWDTLLKIEKDPESVTDEELESLVKPDSLSWDDMEELREVRDKDNHPLKRADSVRAFTFLEELKDIRIATLKAAMKDDPTITSDTLREELLQQFQMKNDLEQWLLEKDRTTEEIEKKVRAMTAPVASDVALSWFERVMWIGRPQLFGVVGTEAERLAKKQREAQIGGIPPLKGFEPEEEDLSKLTDEELEAIIRGK